MTTNNVVPKRWRCSQFLPAAGGSPVLPNQVKAAQNSSDACCLSRYLDLMLVTSSALRLDSHFYAPLPDNDVITRLILSYKPILFLLHCFEIRVTVQVNKCNFISSERDRLREEKPMDASCRTEREDMIATLQTGLWRAEVTQSPLPPSCLSLWQALAQWSGAFLQFVPTSLLNHLHYLTVFSQRELQVSVSKFDESMHTEMMAGKSLLSVRKGTDEQTHTHTHFLKWQ